MDKGVKVKMNCRYGRLQKGRSVEFSTMSYKGYWLTVIENTHTGNIVKCDDLSSIIGVSLSSLGRFITECRKKGYMYSLKNSSGLYAYVVNPAYYFTEDRINHTLFGIFRHNKVFMDSLSAETIEALNREIDFPNQDDSGGLS